MLHGLPIRFGRSPLPLFARDEEFWIEKVCPVCTAMIHNTLLHSADITIMVNAPSWQFNISKI